MTIHIRIDEITTTHIRGFRDHMMAAGHSAATINLRLQTLVTAFNEAKRQGLIDVNPANGVKVRQPKSEGQRKDGRRPFRRSEMLRIIDVSGVEIMGAIVTSLNLGNRNGDVTMMRIGEVNRANAEVHYYNRKGKKDVDVPVLPEWVAFAEEFLQHHPDKANPEAFLFWTYSKSGQKDRVQILARDFADVLIRAGLRDPNAPKPLGAARRTFDLCFHCIRRSLNMACKLSNMQTDAVKALLSQEDDATNKQYDNFGVREMRKQLYKAAGKHELLEAIEEEKEPWMTLEDIMNVTVYATNRLRAIRVNTEAALPSTAPEISAVAVTKESNHEKES